MRITTTNQQANELEADAIVVGIYEDQPLSGPAAAVNQATGGLLEKLIDAKEIDSKPMSVTTLLAPTGVKADQVVVVGIGSSTANDTTLPFRTAGTAAKRLADKKRKRVGFYLDSEQIDDSVCGSMVGCVGQDLYRKEKNIHPFDEIVWATKDQTGFEKGRVLGECVNLARELVNQPANILYPESIADTCVQLGSKHGFDVEVWDQQKLEQEKCGSLLAVSAGSERPPRLVIMRYNGGTENQVPLGLVGKGVTFDSGGYSLKPGDAMTDMKCDMAGAATVVAAMRAIAELKIPVNVIGAIGCVENLVSGKAFKLGDVLTARNGTTIEVLNTDAEGRLVLADTLDVTISQGCSKLIDLATLTGACMVALGRSVAGVMSNSQDWCDQILQASNQCGERTWQLPMLEEYGEHIKSHVADIKNVGDRRWGGAITAAKFLEQFVGNTPWTHIDIAGPSFPDQPSPWIDAGGSGCFVRTLVEIASRHRS